MTKEDAAILEKLKQWFPPRKCVLAVLVTLAFWGLYVWSGRNQVGYFQQWLARQPLWPGWLAAVLLVCWDKWAVAAALTVGFTAGVPVAQMLGDRLDAHYAALITPEMTAEQLHRYGPKHAFIWWGFIAVCVLVGILIQIIVWVWRKRRPR